ncbi:MAG: hypothetical protein HY096_11345 [Nitrospinae bacterium]|nr:hypothetical protein [Nitrospinota bacterium]
MRKLILTIFVFIALLGVSCNKPAEKKGGGSDTIANLMPDMAKETQWKTEGEVRCYKGEELFNYMDGGAELYHAYGFKRACVQDYKKGENLYTMEIYEMENSLKAFGIYSLDRQGEHPSIKQDATYQDGSLNIWKDRYYIRIFILQKGTNIKEEIQSLGEKAVSQIKSEGEMPSLVKLISASAKKDTASSFWQMIPLNNIFFISHENLLNLTGDSEGVTFLYQTLRQAQDGGKGEIRIILIHYSDSKQAKDSFEKFISGYFSQPSSPKGGDEYKGRKGEKTVIARVKDNYLLLSAGVDEAETNKALFESLKQVVSKANLPLEVK